MSSKNFFTVKKLKKVNWRRTPNQNRPVVANHGLKSRVGHVSDSIFLLDFPSEIVYYHQHSPPPEIRFVVNPPILVATKMALTTGSKIHGTRRLMRKQASPTAI
jgi:hypothetical protein